MKMRKVQIPEPVGLRGEYVLERNLLRFSPAELDEFLNHLSEELNNLCKDVLSKEDVVLIDERMYVIRASPGAALNSYSAFLPVFWGLEMGPYFEGGSDLRDFRDDIINDLKRRYTCLFDETRKKFKDFAPVYPALDVFVAIYWCKDSISHEIKAISPKS